MTEYVADEQPWLKPGYNPKPTSTVRWIDTDRLLVDDVPYIVTHRDSTAVVIEREDAQLRGEFDDTLLLFFLASEASE